MFIFLMLDDVWMNDAISYDYSVGDANGVLSLLAIIGDYIGLQGIIIDIIIQFSIFYFTIDWMFFVAGGCTDN